MRRDELQHIWEIAQKHLGLAVLEIQTLFEQDNSITRSISDRAALMNGLEIVQDYIQYNEFGLALEYLCDLIKTSDIPITSKAFSDIDAAGKVMELNPSIWQSLKSNIKVWPGDNKVSGENRHKTTNEK